MFQESSKLLIEEAPLLVLPTLAAKIGLNQAIVLQQIHYALKTLKGKMIDGRKWIFRSEKDWLSIFIFWSRNTMRSAFTALEKLGIVLTGEYNELVTDRTKWYAIDYDKLNALPEKKAARKKRSDYPNFGQSMIQKRRASKVRTMPDPNLGHSLPENTLPKIPEESLSPIAIAPATDVQSKEAINAVLQEVQKAQEATTPSQTLKSPPSVPAVPPALPMGWQWRKSSVHGTLTHAVPDTNIKSGATACGTKLEHRVDMSAPVRDRSFCLDCQRKAQPIEAKSQARASPPVSPEIKNALAKLCKKDWSIDDHASKLGRTCKQLNGKLSLEKLTVFETNWYKCNWQGLKGQHPEPHDVVNKWTEYTEDDCKPDGNKSTPRKQLTAADYGFGKP